jgi:hypothetical protein
MLPDELPNRAPFDQQILDEKEVLSLRERLEKVRQLRFRIREDREDHRQGVLVRIIREAQARGTSISGVIAMSEVVSQKIAAERSAARRIYRRSALMRPLVSFDEPAGRKQPVRADDPVETFELLAREVGLSNDERLFLRHRYLDDLRYEEIQAKFGGVERKKLYELNRSLLAKLRNAPSIVKRRLC